MKLGNTLGTLIRASAIGGASPIIKRGFGFRRFRPWPRTGRNCSGMAWCAARWSSCLASCGSATAGNIGDDIRSALPALWLCATVPFPLLAQNLATTRPLLAHYSDASFQPACHAILMNLQDGNQFSTGARLGIPLGRGQTSGVASRVAANTVRVQNFFRHLASAGRRSNHGQQTTIEN